MHVAYILIIFLCVTITMTLYFLQGLDRDIMFMNYNHTKSKRCLKIVLVLFIIYLI